MKPDKEKTVNKARQIEAIIKQADELIVSDEVYISYFHSINDYLEELDFDAEIAEEIEYMNEIIEHLNSVLSEPDKGFVEIARSGQSFDDNNFLDLYEVQKHHDLIGYIDSNVLEDKYSDLIYISNDKLEDFKVILNNHFKEYSRSPFSTSFYNQNSLDIGWGSKADRTVRVSDHWNFETERYDEELDDDVITKHCLTEQTVITDDVSVGIYNAQNGTYNIIFEDIITGDCTPIKVNVDGVEIIE